MINPELKKTRSFEVGDHTWYLGEIKHTDILEKYERKDALLYRDGEYWTAADKPLRARPD